MSDVVWIYTYELDPESGQPIWELWYSVPQ